MKWIVLGIVLTSSLGCGSSNLPTAPSFVQVGGVWAGAVRLVSATGGDCVGPSIAAVNGGSIQNYTIQITQNGSALTAVVTASATGVTTNYSGTAGASSIVMNATFSTAASIFGFHCLTGALRDINLTNATLTAALAGNTGSGTDAESYNVFVAGTNSAVGILTINGTFTMTRQ